MKLNPLTLKKIRRFKSIKRGYYSFILFCLMMLLSLSAELFVNNRALMVKYEGKYYFPTYGDLMPGNAFGLDYDYETNYRQLARQFAAENNGNWVLMPPVPFNAFENNLKADQFPPFAPSMQVHPNRRLR